MFSPIKLYIPTLCMTVALTLASALAKADTIGDPATLHIGGGVGTACAAGCAGDPNLITTGVLDIYQNTGSPNVQITDTLLIIGIPNDTGFFADGTVNGSGGASVINAVKFYDSGSTLIGTGSHGSASGLYGLTAPTTTKGYFYGDLTSGNMYQFLNLSKGNTVCTTGCNSTEAPGGASETFDNWIAAEYADEPSSFDPVNHPITKIGMYVFLLTPPSGDDGLGGHEFINITFNGISPEGAMAIAYGCDGTDDSCTGEPNPYATPITEAGLMPPGSVTPSPVPEPASLFLLGSGLLGLGRTVRKKIKRI